MNSARIIAPMLKMMSPGTRIHTSAVSYTHLDVYKRQLAKFESRSEMETERMAIDRRLKSLSGRESEVMEGLVEGKANKVIAYDPVSYTHLDVYKRQGFRCAAKRRTATCRL